MQCLLLLCALIVLVQHTNGLCDMQMNQIRRKFYPSRFHRQLQLEATAHHDHILDEDTRQRIQKIISDSRVVLFMKGTKTFPQW